MRNGAVFPIIFFLLLSGCIGQLSEEQKYAQEHSLSEKATGCFDGDGKISVVEDAFGKNIGALSVEDQDDLATYFGCDMAKISDVTGYKDSPFFNDMMNTNTVQNLDTYARLDGYDPSLAEQMAREGGPKPEYNEALSFGLNPAAAFMLSRKQLGAEKSDVYEYTASFEKQAQTEIAKNYDTLIDFNELELLAKSTGADVILRDGLTLEEDKYVDNFLYEINKTWLKDVSALVFNGFLRDGTLTNEEISDMTEFATYPISTTMKKQFEKTLSPAIGTPDYIYFTTQTIIDPRATKERGFTIPPGLKLVVHTDKPGYYVDSEGRRVVHVNTPVKPELGPSPRFFDYDPTYQEDWFYHDTLILMPGVNTVQRNFDGKFTVDSKYYNAGLIDWAYLGKVNADPYYYYYYGIDFGHSSLAEVISNFYYENTNQYPGFGTYIYIYKNEQKNLVTLYTPVGERHGAYGYDQKPYVYITSYYTNASRNGEHGYRGLDENGNILFLKESNYDKMEPIYGIFDALFKKMLPTFQFWKRAIPPAPV